MKKQNEKGKFNFDMGEWSVLMCVYAYGQSRIRERMGL